MSELIETWKPVVGYEGLYDVSDLGRVQTFKVGAGCSVKNYGLIMSSRKNKWGYLYVNLRDNLNMRQTLVIHQLVMAAFVGPCPVGYEIDHKKGIKTDNRLSELEYVTKSENCKRAYALGLRSSPKGEDCNFTKLTENEVRQIPELLKTYSQRQIARIFGVTQSAISAIVCGKSWFHLLKNSES